MYFYFKIAFQFYYNSDSDKVDDMMDAMQEERDIHDAISEAISRPAQDMFDDVSSIFMLLFFLT
jgi:hypothetical protein